MKAGDILDIQGRVFQERIKRIANEIQIIGWQGDQLPGLIPRRWAVNDAVDRGPLCGLERQVSLRLIVEDAHQGVGILEVGGVDANQTRYRSHSCRPQSLPDR